MNRPPAKKDAKAIFAAAIEYYEPHQWEAYLFKACGGDESLRQRVRELLDAHRQSDSFLDREGKKTDEVAVTERPGTQIGPYKLLQEIGEGGFGVVYMAEQVEPVRRKVALKIIKPGMDTKQVIARFEAERQALALMDHPNIAKVLDAGATESGRPYFVMELVRGVPITEYCDKNNLPTDERLQLFAQVCRAIQHAHQKGVIHRDIKPSNVMITLHDGHPVPKVIDFGVSKAISQQLTEKTLFTAYGQMIGTPQYMSPEQAEMSGLDVDTRSDVFSLGVLLYELLTGTTPLNDERLHSLAYAEMQRVICEEEPPRPSARLSTMGGELSVVAKHRGSDAKRLPQLVRGDLDWIVMKALSKERGRRYESASSLAADIHRHLSDEAIEARPPSASYQLARFMRRHKGPAIAAAALLAVLLLGIVGTTTGFVTATGAKRRAMAQAYRAKKAEAAAEANLDTSQQLAGELSTSLAKLSEGASRLAVQRAYALINQEQAQEGLLWLSRALELAPAGDTPLETEIRTAMSAVAKKLPHPQFVLSPEAGQVYSQFSTSRDGRRILLVAKADRTGTPNLLDVRVLDARSGTTVSTIEVPPETNWASLGADGHAVYTSDGLQLRRYSAETGAWLGPDFNLTETFGDPFDNVPPALLETIERRQLTSEANVALRNAQIARIFGPQILAVGPGGNVALVLKRRFAFGERPRAASSANGQSAEGGLTGSADSDQGFQGASSPQRIVFMLLDMESGQTTPLPSGAAVPTSRQTPCFTLDGRRLILGVASGTVRSGTAVRGLGSATEFRAWDIAAGKLQEDWKSEIPGRVWQWAIDRNASQALVKISPNRTIGPIGLSASTRSKLQVVNLESGELSEAMLEPEGAVVDLALSPSGRRAAILLSDSGPFTQLMIWDIETNRSQLISLGLQLEARTTTGSFSSGGDTGGRVAFASDDDTILCWAPELLVAWRLAPDPNGQPDLPTASPVEQLAFVADGRELITVTGRGNSGVRGLAGGFGPPVVRGPAGALGGPSPLGVAAVQPAEIQRWSVNDRRPIGRPLPILAGLGLVSPDGKTLITVNGASIQKWDMATMSRVGEPFSAKGTVQRLEFAGHGKVLITHSRMSGARRERPGRPVRMSYFITGLGLEPVDGGLLITSTSAGRPADNAGLKINDVVLRVDDEPVRSVVEYQQQLDLDRDGPLRLTFLRDGAEQTLHVRPEPRSEGNLQTLLAYLPGVVRLWDLESGLELGQRPVPLEGESSRTTLSRGMLSTWNSMAAVDPDGQTAITVGKFGPRAEIRRFDVASGLATMASVEYPRPIRWVRFGPSGQVCATIDTGDEVQLWRAADLTRIGARIRPQGAVQTLAFSPDGRILLISILTPDGPALSLWGAQSAHRLSPPIPTPVLAHQLACSPDRSRLAATGAGANVWLLPFPDSWVGERDQSKEMAEALVGKTLTEPGDAEPLEADQWARQLARVVTLHAPAAAAESAESSVVWDESFATTVLGAPLSADDIAERLVELDEFISKQPDEWKPRLSRIPLLIEQSRFDEATADLDLVRTHGGRDWTIAWLKRRAQAKSTARLRTRGSLPSGDESSESRVATLLWYGERILAMEPKDATTYLWYLPALLTAGRLDEAEQAFSEAMKIEPRALMVENLRSLCTLPRLLLAGLNGEHAAWLTDRLIEAQPNDWRLRINAADLAIGEERWEDAHAAIDRAIELGPAKEIAVRLFASALRITTPRRSVPPFGSRGERSAIGGFRGGGSRPSSLPPSADDLLKAIPIWEQAIALDSIQANAVQVLAGRYGQLADWEQAARLLAPTVAADPENYALGSQLAPVLLKLGRSDEYRELCREMLDQFAVSTDLSPQIYSVWPCLWQAGALEDYDRVLVRLQAIVDNPRLSATWLPRCQAALGIAHFRSGDCPTAIQWLEKALASEPMVSRWEVRSLAVLAMAYHDMGDATKADELLQAARDRLTEVAPKPGVQGRGDSWHDLLICDLLLAEAETRIAGEKKGEEKEETKTKT